MTRSAPNDRKARDRAKIVCVHCQARKVKCDLEEQDGGICSNCKRRRQNCRRHNDRGSVIHNRALGSSSPFCRASSSHDGNNELRNDGLLLRQSQSAHPQAIGPTLNQPGYIGEQSLMSPSSSVPGSAMSEAGSFPKHVHDEILRLTGATSLPSTSKLQAFSDAYFKNLYHLAPVVDRRDLLAEGPSVLLLQAICLMGSQLRYPRDQSPMVMSEPYYLKIKTLIYLKHEQDNFAILKTLCLLCYWIITPPVVVSLDSTFHWLGVAVRLAYQMGLHRESSYSKLLNPGAARRIMWFLFVADKVQAAAFGRPSMLLSQNLDLRLLELGDFEHPDSTAELFIEKLKLDLILEKIVEFQDRKHSMPREQVFHILGSLEQWIANVPSKFHLHDQLGRKNYQRHTSEMYIHYFSCVILFVHLYGHAAHPSMTPTVSLVASSCMARLYEEIDDRDEISYLTPVHNWSLMVGSVPQIHRATFLPEEDDLCNTELDIFVAALRCMRLKWPPASNILTTVERLRTTKGDARAHSTVDDQRSVYPPLASYDFRTPVPSSLFPFPRDMCPRMALVNPGFGDDRIGVESAGVLPKEGFMDWIFDEFNLDHLDMPFVG